MSEQPLPGGNVGGAVLVDGTVRRRSSRSPNEGIPPCSDSSIAGTLSDMARTSAHVRRHLPSLAPALR